jgi:hypothetical protein
MWGANAPLTWHWLLPVIFQQAEKLVSDQPAGSRGFGALIGRHRGWGPPKGRYDCAEASSPSQLKA